MKSTSYPQVFHNWADFVAGQGKAAAALLSGPSPV